MTNILPPPPDVRNVIIDQPASCHRQKFQAETETVSIRHIEPSLKHQAVAGSSRKLEISCANTTLIGDYTSVVFSSADARWLVQAQGNATLSSTLALIHDGILAIDRCYIFIQLGGNQVRSAEKGTVYSKVLDLVVAIRNKNPQSRIYFITVLPRVIDNE